MQRTTSWIWGLQWRQVIPFIPLDQKININALDGKLLSSIYHESAPIQMLVSGNHCETLQLKILTFLLARLVLGYPWLGANNPHIDWVAGKILRRSSPALPYLPQLGLGIRQECPLWISRQFLRGSTIWWRHLVRTGLFLCLLTDHMTAP